MASFEPEELLRSIDELLAASLEDWQHLYALLAQSCSQAGAQMMLKTLYNKLDEQGLVKEYPLDQPATALLYAPHGTRAQHTLLLYNDFSSLSLNHWELFPIVTQAIALKIYHKLGGDYPRTTYKWLLQSVNETGTLSLEERLQRYSAYLHVDGCLCDNTRALQETGLAAEPIPLLVLGTKGLLRVRLSVQTAPHSLRADVGAIVPAAPWRLLWALSSLKNVQEEILIEGFYDTLQAPADDVIAQLHMLPDNTQQLAQRLGIDRFLYDLQGFQLHYARYLLPTCTINSVTSHNETSSQADAGIPSRSTAELDFHLLPEQDPQDIFLLLRRHLDAHGFSDVQASKILAYPPYATALDNAFVQTVLHATSTAWERQPYVLPFTPAGQQGHQILHKLHLPVVSTAITSFDPAPTIMRNENLRRNVSATIKQIILTLATISG